MAVLSLLQVLCFYSSLLGNYSCFFFLVLLIHCLQGYQQMTKFAAGRQRVNSLCVLILLINSKKGRFGYLFFV